MRSSNVGSGAIAIAYDAPRRGTAHALGLTVLPWTVNDPADIAAQIDAGADGIITDYPDRARSVMAGKGIPLP